MKFRLIKSKCNEVYTHHTFKTYGDEFRNLPSKEMLINDLLTCNDIKEIAKKHKIDIPLLYYTLADYKLPSTIKSINKFRLDQGIDSLLGSGVEHKYNIPTKEELTNDLLTLNSISEISQKYNIPEASIKDILMRFNLPHNIESIIKFRTNNGNMNAFNNKLPEKFNISKEGLQQDLLEFDSFKDIANKYSISGDTLRTKLKKFNLPDSMVRIRLFREKNGINTQFNRK